MVNRRPRTRNRQNMTPESRRNELFEKYYQSQGIMNAEEWDNFMTFLQKDLPITFRVTGFRDQNKELLRLIKCKFRDEILKNKFFSTDTTSPDDLFRPLAWYPNEMAWQLDASRYLVRKTDELKLLQQFLVSETESGNISRQEAVSMLPPLILDVKSHHAVLDMCAAPGSKSAQLVELLHSDAESQLTETAEHTIPYVEPSGVVIANDVDQKRCYMMTHQIKRLQSPCVLITQEDATCFPRLYIESKGESTDATQTHQLLFDRILVDVPCSGDGTLRKNPDLWFRWSPKLGIAEHNLQSRILRRGLELLRDPNPNSADFSRLVYSTCSFNPTENEAVVANVLHACQGAVRLVEPELFVHARGDEASQSNGIPKFKARPGLQVWRVMNKKGEWFSSFDEVPPNQQNSLFPSLFPPPNASELNLDRCKRVLPHDQNTGGFFIALLEKVAPLPWMKSARRPAKTQDSQPVQNHDTTTTTTTTTTTIDTSGASEKSETDPSPLSKKPRLYRECPFTYIDLQVDPEWPKIKEYYGIPDEADSDVKSINGTRFQPCNLLSRSSTKGDRPRNFYYTNSLVKNIIEQNSGKGIRFVNTGVRMFSLMDDKQFSGYRLLQDGVDLADASLPLNSGRRIHLTEKQYSDLVLLLQEEMPLISSMTQETRSQWEALPPGPVLIDYSPLSGYEHVNQVNGQELPRCRLVFPGWRGIRSLRHYIGKHERLHLMRLANLEPTPCIMGRATDQDKNDDNDGDE